MKKLKKYSKIAVIAAIVPMTLSIGLSTPKNVEVNATQVTSEKVDSKNKKPKKPTVNRIVEEQRVVTGKGLPNSTILVCVDVLSMLITREVQTDAKGNWSYTVPTGLDLVLPMSVMVYQKGANGEYSDVVDRRIEIVNRPKIHKIDPIHEGQKFITGKGVPGNQIYIATSVTGQWPISYVDENGNWRVPISDNKTLKAGQEIEVRQCRPNGAGDYKKVVTVKK